MRISDWSSDVCSSDLYGCYTNYVHPAVQKYNLDLALEAVDAGAHDILWDYIRRPEGHPSTMVVPGLDGPSSVVVAEFLADTHDELRVRGAYQGASVFGIAATHGDSIAQDRSEEHTSELQSQMRISYAVFCL